MAGLHYLKHAFGLSDEAVVKGWVENPYWQYFCGEEYFQRRLPIDPSQMTRFRTRLGPSGCEKLLELTITAGLATQTVKPASFRQVTLDTTVQEKAIAFPTDGRLYHKGRVWRVRLARHSGIELRQSYVRKGKQALFMQQRYAAGYPAQATAAISGSAGEICRAPGSSGAITRAAASRSQQALQFACSGSRMYRQRQSAQEIRVRH
jgi:IS5 family transposase